MRPLTVTCETCQIEIPVSRPGPIPRFCPTCRKVRALQVNRVRKYTYPPGRLAQTQREWHARNPGKQQMYRLKEKYKITVERYDQMLESQGGVCAICGLPPTRKLLGVDHDHKCCPAVGRSCGACVRGLLCENCNQGLGRFGDDLQRLENAMNYLRRYR